ncbi:MAG TPA: M23 family metallopeptidase, partial [Bacteroidetes bacterium]|nr:M23 family metallopeptidase [Bacteroidota bacterium]
MFKRNTIYYYDQETCTYVAAKATPLDVIKRIGFFVLFAIAVGLGTKVTFESFFVSFQESKQLAKHAQLMSSLEAMNTRLDQHDKRLEVFHKKNNSLYRPVVGENQISDSYWQGGRGGSARYDKTQNDLVSQTQIRLERMMFQVDLLKSSLKSVHFKVDRKEEEMKNLPSILPIRGTMISGFGNRIHPVTKHVKFHDGLDFACQTGTPIYATGDGRIDAVGFTGNGYGLNVNIDHLNGYRTKFAHMSEARVTDGQSIKRGQLIGYSGNTGMSTGPHLHYEIMHNGVKIDPIDF